MPSLRPWSRRESFCLLLTAFGRLSQEVKSGLTDKVIRVHTHCAACAIRFYGKQAFKWHFSVLFYICFFFHTRSKDAWLCRSLALKNTWKCILEKNKWKVYINPVSSRRRKRQEDGCFSLSLSYFKINTHVHKRNIPHVKKQDTLSLCSTDKKSSLTFLYRKNLKIVVWECILFYSLYTRIAFTWPWSYKRKGFQYKDNVPDNTLPSNISPLFLALFPF